MRPLSPADEHILSLWRELKHIRFQARFLEWAAAARALHRSLRVYDEVVRRYSPDQPRIPAGQTGGGRWTSGAGGDGLEGADGQPREMTQPRRPLAGQYPSAQPAQLARLAVAQARARAEIAQARLRDAGYQPSAGAYATIEGEIAHQEAIAAEARLHVGVVGRAGATTPDTPSPEIIAPGGVRPGYVRDGTARTTRTVDTEAFDRILGGLAIGSRAVEPGTYRGLIFERPDGLRYGLRWSDGSGWTTDIMSEHRGINRVWKLHEK